MQLKNLVTSFRFSVQHLLRRTLVLFLIASTVSINALSCKEKKAVVQEESNSFYTCSMHPQIMEPHPGKCPICGMNLIQVQKNSAPKTDEIKLSEQQIQLGNIHVDTIGKSMMGNETILNATLNFDQKKLTAVSSKVMGRIERLYHKNIGDYIQKGAPLLDVYSEELNNAKQEYLLALERQEVLDNSLINFDQVIESAKTKLILWGMTEGQIKAISKNKNQTPTTTVYSSESGYITSINVQEGDYVSEGGAIVQLADLSSLWAEAQIYTSQFAQFNENSIAIVQIPGLDRKEIPGKVEFVNPEISPEKRLSLIRITIPNQGNQLKPGMSAYVILKSPGTNWLSLPTDAVLRNATGASVWVMTGQNIFKNKMVTVGMESGDRIEITGGLKEGEAVVTSGVYLLNSEYIFKRGSSPMEGMKM